MGNTQPRQRMSKSDREAQDNRRANVLAEKAQDISAVQEAFMSRPEVSQAIVASGNVTSAEFLTATETAKKQLARGGSPFTKPDLIAIAMALTGDTRDVARLESSTVADLNAYIRSIVYDPKRIVNSLALGAPTASAHQPSQAYSNAPVQPRNYTTHHQQPQNEYSSITLLPPTAKHTPLHPVPENRALITRKQSNVLSLF